MKPYRISEIDLNNVVFSSVFTKSDGKKYVPIKYNDERNGLTDFVFQTTELYCDQEPVQKGDYWELNIPLYGNDQSRVLQLVNLLQSFDKKVVNEIERTNYVWFGDNEHSEFRYKNQVRTVPKPDKYRKYGELKVKIMDTPMFRPQILDNNTKKISVRDIKKGTWLRFMFHCVAVWINDNGSGLYLKPIKISQRQKSQSIDYEFVDDSDDEKILDTEFGPFLHTAAQHTDTVTHQNHFIKPVKSVGKIKVTQNLTSISNIPMEGGQRHKQPVKKSHYTPLNETTYEQSSESSDASNTNTDEWKHSKHRRTIHEASNEDTDDSSESETSETSGESESDNSDESEESETSDDQTQENTTSDSDDSDTSDESDSDQVDEHIYDQFMAKHKNQFDIDSSTVHATSIAYNNLRHKGTPSDFHTEH